MRAGKRSGLLLLADMNFSSKPISEKRMLTYWLYHGTSVLGQWVSETPFVGPQSSACSGLAWANTSTRCPQLVGKVNK